MKTVCIVTGNFLIVAINDMIFMKHKKGIVILAVLVLFVGFAFYPSGGHEPIRYVHRPTGEIRVEKVAGEDWLAWLYYNPVGELALEAVVKRKFLSGFYGRLMDKPSSAKKIEPFVREYGIDLNEAEKQKFNSFNDFFTRKLKPGARQVDMDPAVLVSPADGKVLAYENIAETDFFVKGVKFNLSAFLNDEKLAKKYRDGVLLIFRLCPVDYHRFHFPADGRLSELIEIHGDYYSVNPIALRRMADIFWQNKREFVMISTRLFGDVLMTEVGATMVGGIVQTYKGNFAWKGAEKGYFKFGGSTVVLILEKGKVKIDEDLLKNTQKGLETSILMGERVGMFTRSLNAGNVEKKTSTVTEIAF